MPSQLAAAKNAFMKLAAGDAGVLRAVLRVTAKGAFLIVLALMVLTYAVSASRSEPPAPEPLPDYIYS